MNFCKKIFYFLIFILSMFILNDNVNAESENFHQGEWIPNIYINKVMDNGYKRYQQALIIRKTSDNHFAYCLEPFVSLNSNSNYFKYQSNYPTRLNISAQTWERVNLLSYYGYMYEGHEDLKWYAITQVLIWRTIYPTYDIYFTETLNGKRKENAYQNEIAEIEKLILAHKTNISFLSQTININLGQSVNLEDSNGVLNKFQIDNSTLPVVINNNSLTIEGSQIGNYDIKLINKDRKYTNNPLLYQSNDSQSVLITGSYPIIETNLKVNVIGIALKVNKKDEDSKEIIKKSNIKFKIKNIATNEFIENPNNIEDKYIFTTNDDGYFITANNLNFGQYAIIEDSCNLEGYYCNDNPLIIDLNQNTTLKRNKEGNFYYEADFYNKRIPNKIIVHKLGETFDFTSQNIEYKFVDLENITIGLFANVPIKDINNNIIYKKDEIISIKKTNNKGEIIFTDLYLGNYYIKEIKTNSKYQLDENKYYVDLSAKENEINIKTINIKNYLQKGTLTLTKVDSITGKTISDTIIGLYTTSNELISKKITDNDGKITFENLPVGNYYLKEIASSEGYNLSEEIVNVNITSDNEVIYLELKNDPIIEIPDTYQSRKTPLKTIISLESLILILWKKKKS